MNSIPTGRVGVNRRLNSRYLGGEVPECSFKPAAHTPNVAVSH